MEIYEWTFFLLFILFRSSSRDTASLILRDTASLILWEENISIFSMPNQTKYLRINSNCIKRYLLVLRENFFISVDWEQYQLPILLGQYSWLLPETPLLMQRPSPGSWMAGRTFPFCWRSLVDLSSYPPPWVWFGGSASSPVTLPSRNTRKMMNLKLFFLSWKMIFSLRLLYIFQGVS